METTPTFRNRTPNYPRYEFGMGPDMTRRRTSEYIRPMDDARAIANIRRNLAPAKRYDKMFTDQELDRLSDFAYSGRFEVRRNPNGTVFMAGVRLRECHEMFIERFEEILPGGYLSPSIEGNYFITPSHYGLHNDSPRKLDFDDSLSRTPLNDPERKFIPWKNIIIPLWQGPVEANSEIVFFKQRHIDWAHVYNHMAATKGIATTYPIADDHAKLQFHDETGAEIPRENNLLPYDKEHHERYLAYTPIRRLTGLSPELTCSWQPGCPMIFDPVQLHATNKGNPAWAIKMGLLLTFMKEIDPE